MIDGELLRHPELSLRRAMDFGDNGTLALWTLAMKLQRRSISIVDFALRSLLAPLKDPLSLLRILI